MGCLIRTVRPAERFFSRGRVTVSVAKRAFPPLAGFTIPGYEATVPVRPASRTPRWLLRRQSACLHTCIHIYPSRARHTREPVAGRRVLQLSHRRHLPRIAMRVRYDVGRPIARSSRLRPAPPTTPWCRPPRAPAVGCSLARPIEPCAPLPPGGGGRAGKLMLRRVWPGTRRIAEQCRRHTRRSCTSASHPTYISARSFFCGFRYGPRQLSHDCLPGPRILGCRGYMSVRRPSVSVVRPPTATRRCPRAAASSAKAITASTTAPGMPKSVLVQG